MIAQVLSFLPPMGEITIECLAPGFHLLHPITDFCKYLWGSEQALVSCFHHSAFQMNNQASLKK